MEELLTKYSLNDILLFMLLAYFAFKEVVTESGWLKGWLKGIIDKDYKEKRKAEKLESRVDGLEAFLNEKKKVDAGFDELRAVDRRIMNELEAIRNSLEERVKVDDERNADSIRAYILRFNMELVREIKHTREDFIEVLAKIDEYDLYCKSHKDYRNNRAVSAIGNIKRVYDDRLRKHDFL